jgi:Na+/H+ antiporter NhaD/arsenite permease-like protein
VALKLDTASLTNIGSLFLFFIFTLIGSNVFSNVPLTLLVLEQVPIAGDHLSLILYLAFLTTIAGNLTLFGSVANLIVAQKALASSIKHQFNFWTYLKYGFPTTILLSLVGMFIIYGLLQAIH